MYEQFGARVTESRVTFRLFFPDNSIDASQYDRGGSPHIRNIRVLGTFQSALGGTDWDITGRSSAISTGFPRAATDA